MNRRTRPGCSLLVILILSPIYWQKLSSCLATPCTTPAKHAARQRIAVSRGVWPCWSPEAPGHCCGVLPDNAVLFRERECEKEGSGIGLDECWMDRACMHAEFDPGSLKHQQLVLKRSYRQADAERLMAADNEERLIKGQENTWAQTHTCKQKDRVKKRPAVGLYVNFWTRG